MAAGFYVVWASQWSAYNREQKCDHGKPYNVANQCPATARHGSVKRCGHDRLLCCGAPLDRGRQCARPADRGRWLGPGPMAVDPARLGRIFERRMHDWMYFAEPEATLDGRGRV